MIVSYGKSDSDVIEDDEGDPDVSCLVVESSMLVLLIRGSHGDDSSVVVSLLSPREKEF